MWSNMWYSLLTVYWIFPSCAAPIWYDNIECFLSIFRFIFYWVFDVQINYWQYSVCFLLVLKYRLFLLKYFFCVSSLYLIYFYFFRQNSSSTLPIFQFPLPWSLLLIILVSISHLTSPMIILNYFVLCVMFCHSLKSEYNLFSIFDEQHFCII